MSTEFSKVFSALRKSRGLSQRQAASDLNISQALLSHYENGVREPKLDFIVTACEYYGVSADYLLGRTALKKSFGATVKNDFLAPDEADEIISSLAAIFSSADEKSTPLVTEYIESGVFRALLCTGLVSEEKLIDAGMTQASAEKLTGALLLTEEAELEKARPESVIRVEGKVVLRDAATINSKMPTGEIEVSVSNVQLLGEAQVLPFLITADSKDLSEESGICPEIRGFDSPFR